MKISITTKALRVALESTKKAIDRKQTIISLNYFHLEGSGETLTITGGNGETFIRETVPCKAEGRCLLPPDLLALVRTLPEGDIVIETDDSKATVSWDSGSSILPTFHPLDYPTIPDGGDELLSVDGEVLMSAIADTAPHTCDNDLRPAMKGVLIHAAGGSIDFVATDVHTLGLHTASVEHGGDFDLIVPADGVKYLSGLMTPGNMVQIATDGKNVFFRTGGTTLVCCIIKHPYPNYRAIIPTQTEGTLTVDRNALLGAIRRTLICADKDAEIVRLSLGALETVVEAEGKNQGSKAREVLDGATYDGPQMTVGFRGEYLVRCLSTVGNQEVTMRFVAPNKPAMLTSESCLMLIIPVRI